MSDREHKTLASWQCHKKVRSLTAQFQPLVPQHPISMGEKVPTPSALFQLAAFKRVVTSDEKGGTLSPKLESRLAKRLYQETLKRVAAPELRRYPQLYLAYPQIRESVTPEFQVPPERLLTRLSFAKLAELVAIDNPLIGGQP